jgi:hypothetical protein
MSLDGSLRALLLFDIAEEINLPLLRSLLGATASRREPAFRQPAPEYVRFERPPVVEDLGACATDAGKELQARICYFDYGGECRTADAAAFGGDGSWRARRRIKYDRLDYRELAERTDNAIKFLSDMCLWAHIPFGARIGIGDYRDPVTDKLSTARDCTNRW